MVERLLGKKQVMGSIPIIGSKLFLFGLNSCIIASMAKKGEHRITIGLVCSVCKNRNYVTTKNKMETPEKLKLNKFCKHCRKVTEHKETEKLK